MAPSADVRHRGSADARVVTGAVLIQHVFTGVPFPKPNVRCAQSDRTDRQSSHNVQFMYLFYSRIRTGPDTPYTGVASKVAGFRYARSVRL